MHYKNGREAKNGDRVMWVPSYGPPVLGILYDATVGNSACNGKLAAPGTYDPVPNLAECLHADDVVAALADLDSIIAAAAASILAQKRSPEPTGG